MAELATLQATGGVLGDTHKGLEIAHIRADGNYVWVPRTLREENHAATADLTAGTEEKWVDAAQLKAVRDAISLSGEIVTPTSATFAGLPAIPADASAEIKYHTWLTADDIGTGTAEAPQYPQGVYMPDAAFTAWELVVSVSADISELTQAEVTSTAGADYTKFGLASAERLDQWGVSRRVSRVFNTSTSFDFTALNYSNNTAVFIRNTDPSNGIGVTYGAGGAIARFVTRSDGSSDNATNEDSVNVQPLEILFCEMRADGFHGSIIPAERVKNFTTAAAANLFGPLPHDAIITLRSESKIGWRRTGVNSAPFPADGQTNTDWWVFDIGQTATRAAYTDGEEVASDNATAEDGNIRVLEIPSSYVGTDVTAGAKWQFQPGAAQTFPFTFPAIASGADLLAAITAGQLEPLAPEVAGAATFVFNGGGAAYSMAALDLSINQRAHFFSDDNTEKELVIVPNETFGKTVLLDGVAVTGAQTIAKAKHVVAWQTFGSADAITGVTHIRTLGASSVSAPMMQDIWGAPDADTNNTPVNTGDFLHQTGRPIEAVKFTATANAERQTWAVSGQTFTIALSPVNAVPFTIQGVGDAATETSSYDIAADGTVTDNATDANEFNMVVATEDRGAERLIHIISGKELTLLKIWGNVIGAPAGLLDTSYVIDNLDVELPTVRKEYTYFAHTIPDPANGIYEVNGQTVTDQHLADWLADKTITGWSASGANVTMPDWRGRYLGGTGGLGIGTTAGQLLASSNKSHRHSSGQPAWNAAGAFFGTTTGGSGKGISNWDSYSGSQTPLTNYEGSTYARPETVAMPLCVVVGKPQEYVKKADVVEVEDGEVVLINVDASNNTFYPFSTGETWAQVKANYTHLRITGNVSVSGSNNVKPYSFDFDPTVHTLPSGMSGARIDIDDSHNGVSSYLEFPNDTDTGLTYRQGSGDAPTGGRMQFKVVGVKMSKRVVDPAKVAINTTGLTDGQTVVLTYDQATDTIIAAGA